MLHCATKRRKYLHITGEMHPVCTKDGEQLGLHAASSDVVHTLVPFRLGPTMLFAQC